MRYMIYLTITKKRWNIFVRIIPCVVTVKLSILEQNNENNNLDKNKDKMIINYLDTDKSILILININLIF